jgi:hypothetical protein
LPRESHFEEHAQRAKTTAKMIFNGSVAVKDVARRQFVLAVAVTVLTLTILRGVEFLKRRIKKSTDER